MGLVGGGEWRGGYNSIVMLPFIEVCVLYHSKLTLSLLYYDWKIVCCMSQYMLQAPVFTLAFATWMMGKMSWMKNRKYWRNMWYSPILRYFFGICLKSLSKHIQYSVRTFSHDAFIYTWHVLTMKKIQTIHHDALYLVTLYVV